MVVVLIHAMVSQLRGCSRAMAVSDTVSGPRLTPSGWMEYRIWSRSRRSSWATARQASIEASLVLDVSDHDPLFEWV